MTPADWYLGAIVVWLVVWAVLEALHDRWRRKRDKYADYNE